MTNDATTYKVGDIITTTDHINGTRTSFYLVTGRTPHTARIVQLEHTIESGRGIEQCWNIIPNRDEQIGKARICVINKFGHIRIDNKITHIWDGTPQPYCIY
jgi:hypothetical protein